MNKIKQPTKEEIKQARINAGLTQTKAASIVHSGCREWQRWEAGDVRMSAATWELFLIKTGDNCKCSR